MLHPGNPYFRKRALTMNTNHRILWLITKSASRKVVAMSAALLRLETGEFVKHCQTGCNKCWFHSQHVHAIAKTICVERVANSPSDEHSTPCSTNHCYLC